MMKAILAGLRRLAQVEYSLLSGSTVRYADPAFASGIEPSHKEFRLDQLHVFVSVGGTASAAQEAFISAVEDRLKSEGMIPHTIGRNTFSTDAPLKAVPT
jgi:hypothetical protein